jgi:hypothetical protein
MSDFNYATVLTRCMLISAVVLALGVTFPVLPPISVFLGALVPLIWYHTMFLRPRAAEGLPQPAIDSVYYYGFLITIGALGATAVNLSLHGIGDDFAPVAFQFGLGLLATGYAVWARVHLTAKAKILDEEELQLIMSRQIAQSRDLLSNVELASSSFEVFASTLLQRTERFSSDAEARTRSSIDTAIKAFSDGVAAMTEQGQIALADLRGVVNDVTFGAEREALRASVTSMVETVTELSQSLDRLRSASTAGAGSVGDLAGSLERVAAGAATTATRLEPLGREDGVVARFDQAMRGGGEQATEFTTAAAGATAALSGVGEAGIAGRQGLDAFGRKATFAINKLDALGEALNAVAALGAEVGETTSRLTSLWEAAEASSTSLRQAQAQIEALRITAGGFDAVLGGATGEFERALASGAATIEAAIHRFASTIEEARLRAETRVAAASDTIGRFDAQPTL